MINRRRILLISPMPPLVGGVSVSSWRLFLRLKADGYDVSYYNLKFADERLNCKIFLILRYFILPFCILFRKRYDIIHCHVSGTLRKLYIVLMKPFYKGAKLIFTIHGDISFCLSDKLCMSALNKADRIICVQEGDSARLPDKVRKKAVDIPAFILPSNISEADVPVSILRFVKRDNFPVILFNGALVLSESCYDLYGFQDMMEVFGRLSYNGINARLLMVVNGAIDDAVKQDFLHRISSLIRDNDNVMLVWGLQFPFVPLFRYGAVYVRPTKTDGDSLSVREALALGCPVLASDVSCRPRGTIVYHLGEKDELYNKLSDILLSPPVVDLESTDFYPRILHQYMLLFDK